MRRPAHVTWLCLGVITFAGVQGAGVLGSLQLPELPYAAPRLYLAARSAIWALWGVVASWSAFFGHCWGRPLLRWGALALAGWYWVDQILLAESAFSRLGLPWRVATTLLLVGLVWWSLSRPAVRRYFEEIRG